MTHPRPLVRVLFTCAVTAAMTVACGAAPTRSGQQADPVSLTSESGGIEGDLIDALSTGTADAAVRVSTPERASYGTERDDTTEVEILDAMRAGTIDVTAIRADVLASAGATSLAVLQTPWLVMSEQQASRVASDPVAEQLMADLPEIGLVGLALVPAGLRHPFGYGRGFLGPDDYAGQGYNVRHGDGVDAMVRALGARPDHSSGDVRRARIDSGALGVLDTSLLQPGSADLPAVVTSNVTFYTRFDVVVVRKPVWDGLTEAQRAELRASAVSAGSATVAARGTESEALDSWCAGTQTQSVLADQAEIDALHQALEPVVAAATSDPATAALADQVRALGTGTSPPSGRACGSMAIGSNEDYLVRRSGDQDVLDGVWRLEVNAGEMRAAGVSAADAYANAGIWTIRIDGHVATVDAPHGPDCSWDFYFDADEVALDFMYGGNDACWGLAHGRYRLDGDVAQFDFDRERFYDVRIDNAMFARGMRRIG